MQSKVSNRATLRMRSFEDINSSEVRATMKVGTLQMTDQKLVLAQMAFFIVLVVLGISLGLSATADATTVYLRNSAHSFGGNYDQLSTTAGGAADTNTSLFVGAAAANGANNYLFFPGQDHNTASTQTANPQYGWASTNPINDTIPAGQWTFQWSIDPQEFGAGGPGRIQARVFRATNGSSGTLLFTVNGTTDFSNNGAVQTETVNSNQGAYTFGASEYLIVEYWLVLSGGDHSYRFQTNTNQQFVTYPTPIVCSASPNLSIQTNQTLNGNPIDLTSITTMNGDVDSATCNFTVEEGSGPTCSVQTNDIIIQRDSAGETWKYDVENTGSTWMDTGYNDSGWSTGGGIFGTEPNLTIRTPISNNNWSLHFRKTFNVCDPASVTDLKLNALFDDGMTVYINGTQVYSQGVSGDPPAYNGGATSHEATAYETKDIDASYGLANLRSLLVAGSNVLAVGVYNTNGTSTDLVWDGELVISADAVSGTATIHSDNYTNSQSVDTSGWTDGSKDLTVDCNDICGSPISDGPTAFTFASCTDTDVATLNVTNPAASSTVSGIVTIQAQVLTEGTPSAMQNMQVDITGSTGCNVSGGVMSWNGTSSRWEYSWNTSACGTGPVDSGVTVTVSGNDPDCGAAASDNNTSITIDNTCAETATIAVGTVPNPITGTTSISATLGGSGGSGPQVSNDNATWNSSPWNYVPPVSSTGSVTFYAQGTGVCGTINDPTPVTVTYDTRSGSTGATVSFPPGDSRIQVSAGYTGDTDTDNTLLVEWDIQGGPWSGGNYGSQVLANAATPYSYNITGLNNGQAYQVRVSLTDPDGAATGTGWTVVDGQNIRYTQNNITVFSPLIHSSLSTSSSKWPIAESGKSVDGWGIANAQYGAFTCATCHVKGTTNIKRVKTSISAPTDSFPGSNVLFETTDEGANGGFQGFGDDQPDHATSTRICEVCHSITDYHRYDTISDPPGPVGVQIDKAHYNNQDCTSCHKHNLGFRASCDSCHGNPPVDAGTLVSNPAPTGSTEFGAHDRHVVDAAGPQYTCEKCHGSPYGSGANHTTSGVVSINFNAFGSTAGTYKGQAAVTYDGANDGTRDNSLSCSSVYCHGGSIGGSSATWDGSVACGSCHGATAASPPANPASGTSHTSHAKIGGSSIYQGGDVALGCNNCHGAGYGGGDHVDGDVSYDVSALASDYRAAATPNRYAGNETGSSGGRAPSSPYSTCSNLACHWGTSTPTWDNGPADCTTCHSGATTGSTGAPDSGQHAEHVLSNEEYLTCDNCHGAGSKDGLHAGHIDGNLDLGGDLNATIYEDNSTPRNNNANDDSCARACHQQADWGDNGAYNTAAWNGGSGTIDWSGGNCDPATYAIEDLCIDCHSDAYSYGGRSGPTVVTGWDFGGGSSPTGSHLLQNTSDSLEGDSTCGNLEQWKTRCNGCHTKHSGPALVPNPPDSWTLGADTTSPLAGADMQTQLGIRYVGAEHGGTVNGGIHLGGTWTTGSSEAQICWNCHGANESINEWGYNTDPDGTTWPDYNGDSGGTGSPIATKNAGTFGATQHSHNFGVVYTTASGSTQTSAWVNASGTGYWHRDAYSAIGGNVDGGMNRQITAVHSVNFDAAKQVSSVKTAINWSGTGNNKNAVSPTAQEGAADIRCSYCHDVHDLALASGDTASGKPWLRGTWRSNPYPVDLPPESGQTNTTNIPFKGGTQRMYAPRSRSDATHKGGFFIDRNSNMTNSSHSYTAGFTNATDAGICLLCHGGGTSAEVDGMDFYTNSATNQNMWRGNNGHGFAALGGTSNADSADLFDPSFGKAKNYLYYSMGQQPWINMNGDSDYQYALKNCSETGSSRNYGESTMRGGDFHEFGWAPSANRAPIYGSDSNHSGCSSQPISTEKPNTWYQADYVPAKYHNFTCSKCHSPHATGLPALLITNCLDQNISTWSSESQRLYKQAVNCHRKETGATGATDTGWHVLQGGQ